MSLGEEPGSLSEVCFRSLKPEDFVPVKAAHIELFPVKYEDSFFNKAVNSLDRIFSFAAFSTSNGFEELAGFLTARLTFMYELDAVDRYHITNQANAGACASTSPVVYILTLGVVPSWQKRGLASALLGLARQHALDHLRCCVIYLHVITYNEAAINMYLRNQYQCLGLLKDFYSLPLPGPQPSAERTLHDAYLFVQYLPHTPLDATCSSLELEGSSRGGWLAPVVQVSSTLGRVLPLGGLWQAWGHIHTCMPWFSARQALPAFQAGSTTVAEHCHQQQDGVTHPHMMGASPLLRVNSSQHKPPMHAHIPHSMLQQQQPQPVQQVPHRWDLPGGQGDLGKRPDSCKQTQQAPTLFQWFTAPPQ